MCAPGSGSEPVRAGLVLGVGAATFVAALSGFLYLGMRAGMGTERVLVAARGLSAGTVLSATTQDLSQEGESLRAGNPATLADLIPQRDYAQIEGSILLVGIRRGELILRHDLVRRAGNAQRLVTVRLADLPNGVTVGSWVDLYAVSGTQTGLVNASANLCQAPQAAGCVVPLAAGVMVAGVDQPAATITIAAAPSLVSEWLYMDATQLIWAVPAGIVRCPGAELAVANPMRALEAIQRARPAVAACSGRLPPRLAVTDRPVAAQHGART